MRAELTEFSTGHAELRVPVRAVLCAAARVRPRWGDGLRRGHARSPSRAARCSARRGRRAACPSSTSGPPAARSSGPAPSVVTATGSQAVVRCEVLVTGTDGESLCAVAQGTVRLLHDASDQGRIR